MSFGKQVADLILDVVQSPDFRGLLKMVELTWKGTDGSQFSHTWVAPEPSTTELLKRITQDLPAKDAPAFLMAGLSLTSEFPEDSGSCHCFIPLVVEDFDEEDDEVEVVEKEFKPEHCNCNKKCKSECKQSGCCDNEEPDVDVAAKFLCGKMNALIKELKQFTAGLENYKKCICD